jgi:uncharacterized protein YdhG (YjbR/CyaY superfamily)
MAKISYKSVDEYIAAQPEVAQGALRRVRSIIRKAMPAAEEVISYQIPAYRLHGGVVIYFAGWREHYSLYPLNDPLLTAFKEELASYKLSKGTIRFPLSGPVPVKLIERLARFRARQAAEMAKGKSPQRKKSSKPSMLRS